MSTLERRRAEALDAADPLAAFRDRFVVDDPSLVYLDGNSLGRLPLATIARLERSLRGEWGRELVRAWDHWIDLPVALGDRIGTELIGAAPGQTAIGDSTSVNLYRLASAALDARLGRRVIVTDRGNFPTDRYILEGLAAARGLEIRWLSTDPVEGISPGDVAAALDAEVALVSLSHVDYRSAAVADMAAITTLAHQAGALALWDLSHSVGSVPVELDAAAVDLAVGCTYKYLNGGPGSPAFLYVRHGLQETLRQPIWGWFGQRDQFAMGPAYERAPGIRAFLVGTPPILAMAAVEAGVDLVAEAGIAAIRAKGMALADLAVELFDAWLAPLGFELGSPRDAVRRGSHVSIRRGDAAALCERLVAESVVPDFRAPDGIRIGLSPLTTRFTDAWDGLARLADLADEEPA
jgi:kynureninase